MLGLIEKVTLRQDEVHSHGFNITWGVGQLHQRLQAVAHLNIQDTAVKFVDVCVPVHCFVDVLIHGSQLQQKQQNC